MQKPALAFALALGLGATSIARAEMLPQAIDCTGPGSLEVHGYADSDVLVVTRPGERDLRLSVILLDADYPAYSVVGKKGNAVAGLVINNVRSGAPNQSFLKLKFGADVAHPDHEENYGLDCTIR